MRHIAAVCSLLLFGVVASLAGAAVAADDPSLVVVFKDGHRQSFALTQISRIDFKMQAVLFTDGHQEKISPEDILRIEFETLPKDVMLPGRSHFLGKWEVGEGNGSNFFITLEEDGQARKSIGASHGTWALVNGEARISWDDGWRDIIRKVGTKHEKFAFEPGKSFTDPPSNVTAARNTQAKPI
ncbi:MAG TPA: hypothetical protein VMB19_08720 [Silvibacterium sp.]|nr:hypothetical protein [Silvibacterium sp.]